MRLLRLAPDNTKFPFMRFRRWSFPFSAIASILAVLFFTQIGMNFGIDFKGGTLIELQSKAEQADLGIIRSKGNELGFGEIEVQAFGTPRDVSVRIALQDGGDVAQQAVVEKMRAAFGDAYEFRRVEVVGPRVSGELVQSGTLGIVLSVLVVMVYLWFRFEWQFAVGAIIATLHDLVLAIGFFAITRIEFNLTSIAAILTIVGYSMNDTVVVFDRIREMLRKYKKLTIHEVIDISINTTLARTLATSATTFLATLALYMFGGEVIRGFAAAMLFGVIVGAYSSVFVAAPILIYLGLKVGSFEKSEANDQTKLKASSSAAPSKA
jgi:preprotein translocase subunit SecF